MPIPDLGTATPLTLDQIDLDAPHGVKVGTLGEDNDEGVVAFTHDRRRAFAATNRLLRNDLGNNTTVEVLGMEHVWWLVVSNCGCGPACPHEPDDAGDRYHEDCATYGLPPCIEEHFAWMGLRCDEGTPGALPVTILEVDY